MLETPSQKDPHPASNCVHLCLQRCTLSGEVMLHTSVVRIWCPRLFVFVAPGNKHEAATGAQVPHWAAEGVCEEVCFRPTCRSRLVFASTAISWTADNPRVFCNVALSATEAENTFGKHNGDTNVRYAASWCQWMCPQSVLVEPHVCHVHGARTNASRKDFFCC